MPHKNGAKSPVAERTQPDTPPPSAGRKRWTLKMMLAPLLLTAAAAALGLTAWKLYPRNTESHSLSYANLYVTTRARTTDVDYYVTRTSPGISQISVEVQSRAKTHAGASVYIILPPGTFFKDCPHPACQITGRGITDWAKKVTFKYTQSGGWAATAHFLVKADRFGFTFNRVNASASIPDVTYDGPGKPFLIVDYKIPSAARYDWSPVPLEARSSFAYWEEPLTRGETAAQTSTGVNRAAQADDTNKTFIAGALLGLAGGAILSAIQEFFHAFD